MTVEEKLTILTDAAKYDVACTSSGVERRGKKDIPAMRRRRASVTVFPPTGAVFPF